MSKRRLETTGAMLDLWRPPAAAGDPIGCLATTYTFKPGLFDQQCLARFLEIDLSQIARTWPSSWNARAA